MQYPIPLGPQHLDAARLFATRKHLVKALAHRGAVYRIAEVGVAFGDFSKFLIDTLQPEFFDAYDTFKLHELETLWGKPTAETFRGKTHRDFYEDRFHREIEAGMMSVIEGDSSTCLAKKQDAYYDIIYLDGDHRYEGVRKDTAVAINKLRRDGILVFNDYGMGDKTNPFGYGVVHVVNDLCVNHGWRITHFALQFAMLCDVALMRSNPTTD